MAMQISTTMGNSRKRVSIEVSENNRNPEITEE